jgi:hypothetical protein
MGFILGVVSSIVANLVFWVGLGAVFWAAGSVVARRFSRFFGLTRIGQVGIYLSNLSDKPAGATISLHELRAAQSVDRLFGSSPLRLPDLVRGLVDALWLRQKVRVTIEVSPVSGAAVRDRNLLIVGSAARNPVRAQYVRAGLPTAILAGEGRAVPGTALTDKTRVTVRRDGTDSDIRFKEVNLAVVEKCHDPDRGTMIFFCLGVRGDGSWAATEYLVRNWKRLDAEFGSGDFVVCLGFPQTETYMEDYQQPLRLSIGS